MTTQNLGDNLIPKRVNTGSPHNFLDHDRMIRNAMMQYEQDKISNGYAKFSDVIEKIRGKLIR